MCVWHLSEKKASDIFECWYFALCFGLFAFFALCCDSWSHTDECVWACYDTACISTLPTPDSTTDTLFIIYL